MHFSRLPFLPEIDALKEDLSIINDTFQHLQMSQTEIERNYVEAYKYAFSRKGERIENFKSTFIINVDNILFT
jgi:hypothetical protein